jgi:hypothetical protein
MYTSLSCLHCKANSERLLTICMSRHTLSSTLQLSWLLNGAFKRCGKSFGCDSTLHSKLSFITYM